MWPAGVKKLADSILGWSSKDGSGANLQAFKFNLIQY